MKRIDLKTAVKQHKWFIAAIVVFSGTVTWLSFYEAEAPLPAGDNAALLPVTVVALEPEAKTLSITTTGITEARWPTSVVAAVGGRVEMLATEAEPGNLVSRDQTLLQLRSTDYRAAVDAAASRLADARLTLAREQHEQTVTLKTGGRLTTPFARRELQVAAAKAEVNAAESALADARQRLSDTHVKAPFTAIVLERHVTPGQWVQTGEPLLRIAASESLDVRVELPARLWQRLGNVSSRTQAEVITPTGGRWPAGVRYLSPTRERETRQRSLILKVATPYQGEHPLLPDQQVDVVFSGPAQADVFAAPASVLTTDGQVWTVDANGQLVLEDIEILHEGINRVLIRFESRRQQPRRLVRYPLGSMLEGQQVAPEPEPLRSHPS
ncbi:efflux RND transporter periplasmic adaptor subunit [Exilibacterium tricleocarpae]|uniref:efflux RND transporter periplasmic adaptor subunit n=1 Tax=Exilibacterium tricleocarpae TaxID=2591008 RepID=UPI0015D3C057|nr:efflux RND transporter periplasmic adaptor subunit [Exilibacterium tricleocarpae]